MDKLFLGPAKKQEHASSKSWGRNVEKVTLWPLRVAKIYLKIKMNRILEMSEIVCLPSALLFYDLGKKYLTVEMMTTLLSCP